MYDKRYPPAQWKGDGQSGGAYTPAIGTPGFAARVVFHTTETKTLPGYGGGAVAPHLTYDPKSRTWYQHTYLTNASRALLNVSGGVQTNRDGALQVEIICYSDESTADKVKGLRASDLSDEALADLGAFVWWAFENWSVPLALHPLTMKYTDSKAFGAGAASRMSFKDWDHRTSSEGPWGICAHRTVPENKHWDTGKLNIPRILEHAKGHSVASAFTDVPEDHPFHDDIQWAFETGISTGYTGGRAGQYGPDDPVTRAQMAAFLRRALSDADTVKGLKRGLRGVKFEG